MTENATEATYEPVKVHLTSSDVLLGTHPRQRRLAVTCRTVVLTATNPFAVLLGIDPTRDHALVQASGTNPAVLCNSDAQAQDPANATSGLPNPNGALLPSSPTAWARMETTEAMWAAAGNYPCPVSVISVNEVEA